MYRISRSSAFTQQDTITLPNKNSDSTAIFDTNQIKSIQPNVHKTLISNIINGHIKANPLKDTVANQPIFLNHLNNNRSLIENNIEYFSISSNKDSNCYILNKQIYNKEKLIFAVDKKENKTYIKKDYTLKERIGINSDWTIIPVVLGLFLLASIVTRYRKYLGLLFESLIYRFSTNKIFNERNNQIQRLTIILDILYLIALSLTIDQVLRGLNIFEPPSKLPFIVFAAFLTFLITLRLFRLIIFKLSALFSNQQVFFKELLSSSLVYTRTLGLFLLPLVFLITYSTGTINLLFVYLAVFVIFIILIMRTINMFRAFIVGGFSIFYFILYLCALEILPLLVIWKEVKSR